MKRIVMLLLLTFCVAGAFAQECRPEWSAYTSSDYVYSCYEAANTRHWSAETFKENLTNSARQELAKQFEVNVNDYAVLDKSAVNGHSQISYSSLTTFSTSVTLKLVKTKFFYNETSDEGTAIAYINKLQACDYYQTEFELAEGRVANAIANAETLSLRGEKIKARDNELKPVLKEFDKMGDALAWLALFDFPRSEISAMMNRCYALQQRVKTLMADLSYATTLFFDCSTPMFEGRSFPMAEKLSGSVAPQGVNFVRSSSGADYVVSVKGTPFVEKKNAFNSSEVGQTYAYVVRCDVTVAIYKAATNQTVYSDQLSAQGKTSTRTANPSAESAYNDIYQRVMQIVMDKIK